MTHLIIGIVVFILFIIYDINSITWKDRILHLSFYGACTMIIVSTIISLNEVDIIPVIIDSPTTVTVVFTALAIAAFILLIYTLFIALPFEETYIRFSDKPSVYDRGMYALCRHPGVIWFILFYVCISIVVDDTEIWKMSGIYCLVDVLYVAFQDIWTFPRSFSNYDEYKTYTPFLIPNGKSIRRAFKTFR